MIRTTPPCCPREPDVLRAAALGWHDAARELIAHVQACPRCTDVRAAADLLRRHWLQESQAARVPPAAAMWWRLDRRLRAERVRRAHRVALALQAMVLAAALGAAIAVLEIATPWLAGPGRFIVDAAQGTASILAGWPAWRPPWPPAVTWALGAWVLLLPLALYLTLADE
jgi:hypothetical protein